MDLPEQKIDASNKIKELVVKHNLDISDKEITKCVEDLSKMKPLSFVLSRCSAEDCLKVVNEKLNSNLTSNTPLSEILDKLTEKWESL
ncbi:MAG: hypothetical protein PHF88_02905 [Candidatus Pacebacteria bacterium]|jgi:hypothetical protein|nr:hypothetical protein [Candidatus Paceibacterota bacterium]